MKGETFNAQRSTSNVQPVRDLHECAARSAQEHAEFLAFYREHVMGSQVIHELVGRYAWAAIEKAAWLAWKAGRAEAGSQKPEGGV